jgi:hypothetical protein
MLRDIQGMSTEEASAMLNVKDQTQKSRACHAAAWILRKQLADFAGGLTMQPADLRDLDRRPGPFGPGSRRGLHNKARPTAQRAVQFRALSRTQLRNITRSIACRPEPDWQRARSRPRAHARVGTDECT